MTDAAPHRAFAALADPTRAAIVEWLGEGGSGTATSFAARFPISRQAVTRHLKELEGAGLVVATREGREVRYTLEPDGLSQMTGWLEARAARWERTLRRLAEHLDG